MRAFLFLSLLLLAQPQTGYTACATPAPVGACNSEVSSAASVSKQRQPLTSTAIEKAIRKSLGEAGRDAQIRVLEFDRTPVGPGTLEFPLQGAVLPQSTEPRRPFIWRGTVIGELGNDSPVWARVQVVAMRKVVRTTVRLLAGNVLDASELEAVEMESSPLLTPKDEAISDYAGMSARRSVASLTVLNKDMVQAPPMVRRGSMVHVTAVAGLARISVDCEAHSDGRLGQSIQVTNARTGRSFFAVVSGQDRAVVKLRDSANL
jgi:flagella basal body P-ring formation protein FlgA